MTKEEIIEVAIQAGIKRRTDEFYSEFCDGVYFDDFVNFAKLIAKHTLMNIDPSKFMSFQEGIDVGRIAEREECAKICDFAEKNWLNYCHSGTERIIAQAISDCGLFIRARGQE